MILKSHNIMDKKGIFFFYSGYISENILQSLSEAVQEKMSNKKVDTITSKKIFNIFRELSKNVLHCTTENLTKEDIKNHNDMCRGIIVIGEEKGNFHVSCGSIISKSYKEKIKIVLDKIRKMSKEQLKQMNKESLENVNFTDINLIEVAKSSSEPISYEFEENDEDTNFFFLQTVIR